MNENPIDVCGVDDVEDGSGLAISSSVTGLSDTIAVFREGENFFALDDTCSHEEASLSEGWVEDGEVECPEHQSRFDLRTGKVSCLPATCPVRAHRVEIRDGRIFVTPGLA